MLLVDKKCLKKNKGEKSEIRKYSFSVIKTIMGM